MTTEPPFNTGIAAPVVPTAGPPGRGEVEPPPNLIPAVVYPVFETYDGKTWLRAIFATRELADREKARAVLVNPDSVFHHEYWSVISRAGD